eukprot:Skav214714  [mRNA]  locus=scaffold2250:122088:124962:+ [translate_table: standard]
MREDRATQSSHLRRFDAMSQRLILSTASPVAWKYGILGQVCEWRVLVVKYAWQRLVLAIDAWLTPAVHRRRVDIRRSFTPPLPEAVAVSARAASQGQGVRRLASPWLLSWAAELRLGPAGPRIAGMRSTEDLTMDIFGHHGWLLPEAGLQDEIKKAYYDKMKICHPDIAGEDGALPHVTPLWMP